MFLFWPTRSITTSCVLHLSSFDLKITRRVLSLYVRMECAEVSHGLHVIVSCVIPKQILSKEMDVKSSSVQQKVCSGTFWMPVDNCYPKHQGSKIKTTPADHSDMCAFVFPLTPPTLARHFASHSSTSDFPNFSSSPFVSSRYVALCIRWPSAGILGSGQTELLRNVPPFNGRPSGPQHGSTSPSLTARGLSFWWRGELLPDNFPI